MAVLVTGAAGFIGSNVARALLQQDVDVVGVDVLDEAYDPRLKQHRLDSLLAEPGFRFEQLDIRRSASVDEAFQVHQPETVFHLAARAGVRSSLANPDLYVDVNGRGTLALLEACRHHDVPRLVMASTSSVYGRGPDRPFREDDDTSRPLSPYAASKKGAEVMCAAYTHLFGIHTPVLRFFTVYGPAGRPDMSIYRFIEWMRAGKPLQVYGDGRQRRDFTYVEDVASGIVAAGAVEGHEPINLGGGAPASLEDVIGRLERILGLEATVERGDAAPADVPATWADIGKAERLMDWRPCVSLDEGLRRTVAWHQENLEVSV